MGKRKQPFGYKMKLGEIVPQLGVVVVVDVGRFQTVAQDRVQGIADDGIIDVAVHLHLGRVHRATSFVSEVISFFQYRQKARIGNSSVISPVRLPLASRVSVSVSM